jgi:Ca-activated chloride channel family protein
MKQHALGLTLALDERGLHPATKARVHLVAEVSARAPGIERSRPPLSVVLAVDVSGSMVGAPLEQVVLSIDRLVGLLEPTDRVGVVAFSDNAAEIAPLLSADGDARRLIASRARRLFAEGATNIEAGLERAAKLLPPRGEHERQVILLLSDGAPNRGRVAPADLAAMARSLRPAIGVSTLGYGPQHHEDVLRAIADAGAGRYSFIQDPTVCELEFAQAIGAQGDVVAEAIELVLTVAPGVEIARFLGKADTRIAAGGIKIALPDMLDGSRHLIAAELDLTPKREPGAWEVLRASLSYRRAGERDLCAIAEPLVIDVGMGSRAVVPSARALVLRARADEVRAEARAHADRGQFEGAASILRKLIGEIQAEPWFAANDGSPLAETVEQLVDEAAALERKPSAEQYQSFRKTQLGTAMSIGMPAGLDASPMTSRALASVAGPMPEAYLVIPSSPREDARRIRLDKAKAVIGRTAAADIRVGDGNVSRQHALIAAMGGRFLLMDLGSTNVTQLNGKPVVAPSPLAHGDVIKVGEVELRYEEPSPRA